LPLFRRTFKEEEGEEPEPDEDKKRKEQVRITPPNFQRAVVEIQGINYVQHRFSEKAKKRIQATQALSSKARKGGASRS
jgi:hypothetical protein